MFLLFCVDLTPFSAGAFFPVPDPTVSPSPTPQIQFTNNTHVLSIKGLLPTSEEVLIPVDEIPLNLPLYNTMGNPLFPETTAEMALYANLKLLNLLEEYDQVRDRAQEFLHYLEENQGPQSFIGPGSPFLQQTLPTDNQPLSDSPQKPTPNTEQTQFTRYTALIRHLRNNQSAREEKSLASSQTTHFSVSQAPSQAIDADTPADVLHQASDYYCSLAATSMPSSDHANTTVNSSHQKRQYDEEEIELPWLIAFPLKIIQYIATHIIESLVAIVLLLTLLSLSRGIFSK